MANSSYSVNQLKAWSKCKRRYEFDYVRRLQWPSDPKNFRLGKGVHQLLDYGSRTLPLETIIADTDTDIAEHWDALTHSDWGGYPVVASEWGFSLGLSEESDSTETSEKHWIYGRIDRIVQIENTIHVLDWKTGTAIPRFPETDWQTVVYLYAVYSARNELNLDIGFNQLYFTYVQAGKNGVTPITVPYTEALHRDTHTRLLTAFFQMQEARAEMELENVDAFQLPLKCPDKYCPYGTICGIHDISIELDMPSEMDWIPEENFIND